MHQGGAAEDGGRKCQDQIAGDGGYRAGDDSKETLIR